MRWTMTMMSIRGTTKGKRREIGKQRREEANGEDLSESGPEQNGTGISDMLRITAEADCCTRRRRRRPSRFRSSSFLCRAAAVVLLLLLGIGTNLGGFPRASTVCHAWEWSDYWVGADNAPSSSPPSAAAPFSMEEISAMRVRDLKRHLTRRHGYGADEVGRILDKKELIELLAFEEEKALLQMQSKRQRAAAQKGVVVAVLAVLVAACWPLILRAYEIVEVNAVVYADRKRHEASVCRELRSVSAFLGFGLMLILDVLQLWLSVSVALSWFVRRRSKYLFPTPSIPLRPGQLLGGPVAQSAAGGFGINVGPMAVTWAMRWVHGRLEAWTGRALVKARQAQRRRAREAESAEERAARKEARKQARAAEAERLAADTSGAPTTRPSATNESVPSSWMHPHSDEDGAADRGSTSATHKAFLQQIEEYSSPLDELD